MENRLDSETIRRRVLHNGGDIRATARELEMSHTNVIYHLRRANERSPLTHGKAPQDDQAAINGYLKRCLDRLGIRHD